MKDNFAKLLQCYNGVVGHNETWLSKFYKINCIEPSISEAVKSRSKKWIEQIRRDEDPEEIIVLVCAMASVTKVPPIGEYFQKYHAWVGGQYPDHCIDNEDYQQEKFG